MVNIINLDKRRGQFKCGIMQILQEFLKFELKILKQYYQNIKWIFSEKNGFKRAF